MGCDTFEINLVLILSQVFQVTGLSRVTNQEWYVKSDTSIMGCKEGHIKNNMLRLTFQNLHVNFDMKKAKF